MLMNRLLKTGVVLVALVLLPNSARGPIIGGSGLCAREAGVCLTQLNSFCYQAGQVLLHYAPAEPE